MKTTDDPNVFYDEMMDEYVLHGKPEGCYVVDAGKIDGGIIGRVDERIVKDFGELVDCDEEDFSHAE
jgi:hypothetical protein